MLPRATINFLASGGDEMAEGGQTRMNRHQRRAHGKLSQPHQHSHGEPCPGCNSRTVLMHIVGQRDDLKNAVGEPVFYPIAEGETAPAIADFGILAVGLDPSSKAITVTAYGREVFRMLPEGVEHNEPGAWRNTLAAIAADLDAQFGPPREL
jgi:hypothetical protein